MSRSYMLIVVAVEKAKVRGSESSRRREGTSESDS